MGAYRHQLPSLPPDNRLALKSDDEATEGRRGVAGHQTIAIDLDRDGALQQAHRDDHPYTILHLNEDSAQSAQGSLHYLYQVSGFEVFPGAERDVASGCQAMEGGDFVVVEGHGSVTEADDSEDAGAS